MKISTNIAVLMTCHNRQKITLTCLKALYEQQLSEDIFLSVYLTDDGCNDGTPEAIKKSFPNVHIIHGNGKLYWNRGMLAAWEEAAKKHHDFYLWLNDDTFLTSHALASIVEDWQNAPQHNCIIVGATTSPDGKKTTYSGRVTRGDIIPPNGTLQPCQEFNGNCVLVPNVVFEKLGMLDRYFRHSFGDIEYGMRANRAGIPCYVARNHVGVCEEHSLKPKWLRRDVPIIERFRHFYSPLGMSPLELFYLNRKYNGIMLGGVVFLLNHWRCLIAK